MVTAYCIMNLSKSKPQDYEAYYRSILETRTNTKSVVKCRVCLKEGKLTIFNQDICNDIVDLYKTFVGGNLREDDELPKHLCNTCFKFFKAVILFKKTAVKSENYLRSIEDDIFKVNETESMLQEKSVKEETMHQTDDNFHDNDDDELDNKSVQIRNSQENSHVEKIISNVEIKPEENAIDIKEFVQMYYKPVTLDIEVKTPRVQCQVCNKIISKSYCIEHFAFHDPSVSHFECEVCGKSFRQRCAYKNHIAIHSYEFPYQCELCEYKACTDAYLKNHMKTHKRDYRYLCSKCPARFLTKSNLNKHMYRHKERMFHCEVCNKAFRTEIACKRHHEVIHLGLMKHVCDICGKSFGYSKAFRQHQIGVHNINSKTRKLFCGRPLTYLQHLGNNAKQVPTVVQ